MQSLTFSIVWQIALVVSAAEPHAALPAAPPKQAIAKGYEPVVAEYKRMTAAERQQYVERLIEGRLEPAAHLALDDAALARQQAIDREILTRLRAGQAISPQGLVKLLRKLDALEAAAVESLLHNYRVEAYSLFHSQRHEYERRIEVWKRVESAWEAGGQLPDEQRELIAWLRRATDRLRADSAAKLPPIPKFAERHEPPRIAQSPAGPPRFAEGRRTPAVEQPTLKQAQGDAGKRNNASQLPNLEHVAPRAANLPVAKLPSPPITSPATPRQPATTRSPVDGNPPRTLATKPLTKQPAQLYLALRPAEHPTEPAAATPTPVATGWLESRPGQIDLDELSVRIAGHNLALSRLAGGLHSKALWTAEQLTAAVAELEDLTARRGDLLLYWEMVSENERRIVGPLRTPAATIALLGAKISQVHNSLVGPKADPTEAAYDERVAEIDGLSRRLAQLATQPDR